MAVKTIPYDATTIAGKATVRFANVSARKARLVIDMIRYKSVGEADTILKFTVKPSAAPIVKKLLDAAKASVNRRDYSNVEDLIIGEVYADVGPSMKRVRPQSRGRANYYRRRMCHITLRLMPPIS